MVDFDPIHSLRQRYQQGRGNELFGEIELILQETSADWTIFWRQLARIAAKYATGEKPGESVSDDILQSKLFKLLRSRSHHYSIRIALSSAEKSLFMATIHLALQDELHLAFYEELDEKTRAKLALWLRGWLCALAMPPTGDDKASRWTCDGKKISAAMDEANPMFVPREWMLVKAYTAADKGDHSLIDELRLLFSDPYGTGRPLEGGAGAGGADWLKEMKTKYYRKAPAQALSEGGTAVSLLMLLAFCIVFISFTHGNPWPLLMQQ